MEIGNFKRNVEAGNCSECLEWQDFTKLNYKITFEHWLAQSAQINSQRPFMLTRQISSLRFNWSSATTHDYVRCASSDRQLRSLGRIHRYNLPPRIHCVHAGLRKKGGKKLNTLWITEVESLSSSPSQNNKSSLFHTQNIARRSTLPHGAHRHRASSSREEGSKMLI